MEIRMFAWLHAHKRMANMKFQVKGSATQS